MVIFLSQAFQLRLVVSFGKRIEARKGLVRLLSVTRSAQRSSSASGDLVFLLTLKINYVYILGLFRKMKAH